MEYKLKSRVALAFIVHLCVGRGGKVKWRMRSEPTLETELSTMSTVIKQRNINRVLSLLTIVTDRPVMCRLQSLRQRQIRAFISDIKTNF